MIGTSQSLLDAAHYSPMAQLLSEAVDADRHTNHATGYIDPTWYEWLTTECRWLRYERGRLPRFMYSGTIIVWVDMYEVGWFRWDERADKVLKHRTDGGPAHVRHKELPQWWVDGQRLDNNPAALRLARQWEQAERDYDRVKLADATPVSYARAPRMRV